VNNHGDIAASVTVGFDPAAYMIRNGKLQNLIFPGATFTGASSINDNGVVVGYYFVYPNFNGFLYKNGKYFSFSYPGALYTAPNAINNAGQIVGAYSLDNVTYHGFVTDPISPADLR
jgi:probable HAF family extracellular repeat protein